MHLHTSLQSGKRLLPTGSLEVNETMTNSPRTLIEFSYQNVASLCDQLLQNGRLPSIEMLTHYLEKPFSDDELKESFEQWQAQLSERIMIREQGGSVPDVLQQSVKSLWQKALFEATQQLAVEQQQSKHSMEILKDTSDELLLSSRADYEHLERRYQAQLDENSELINQLKLLEAEIKVLNANLQDEVKQRKHAEERLQDGQQQVQRAQKSLEDTKINMDARLKDEQAHTQEQLGRMESELSHYRRNLDRVRDEAGKKESALTKNIHDLQAEMARRDVKIDTLKGQAKSVDQELRSLRADTGSKGRELAAVNAKLLSETNKVKRLEDRVKQVEGELRQEQQRLKQQGNVAMHKEADLRKELQIKEDELIRAQASINSLQKKQLTFEEQIRRLQSQLPR